MPVILRKYSLYFPIRTDEDPTEAILANKPILDSRVRGNDKGVVCAPTYWVITEKRNNLIIGYGNIPPLNQTEIHTKFPGS